MSLRNGTTKNIRNIGPVKIIAKALRPTNPRFNENRFTLAAMNWE